MKNIKRLFQEKISDEEKVKIRRSLKKYIFKFTTPIQIYLYGSILSEKFDPYSDVDVLIIYKDEMEATQSIKKLQENRSHLKLDFPIEFVCVSKDEFKKKSQIGGLYFVIAQEGEVI